MSGSLAGWAQEATYRALLGGANEALPVVSTGFGDVTITLSADDTITVAGSFENLTSPYDESIGSHLHIGYAGENGPVTLVLTPALDGDSLGGTFAAADNTFGLTAEQATALSERRLYVNIHTDAFPSGELRGQVLPTSEFYYRANLFGSHEVPSVVTGAAGSVVIEQSGNDIVVTGSFAGLEGDYATNIGMHLHLGAPGVNGPVEVVLSPTLGGDDRSAVLEATNNTFTLSAEQVVALSGRRLYVNVHSLVHPTGEIRGPVVSANANAVFCAHLSGANERPVVTTRANGELIFEVAEDTVRINGAFAGLESDFDLDIGAHIHAGYAGQNGPIIFAAVANPLAPDNRSGQFGQTGADQNANVFTFTEGQLDTLLARAYYFNIHSVDNPAGELRGQILPESQYFFTGFMSGTQEVPPIATRALGGLAAEYQGGMLTVTGAFDDLESDFAFDIAGGTHLHAGYAGQNGPIRFLLAADVDADNRGGRFLADSNVFMLNEAQTDSLRGRIYYANLHTTGNPGGELRAQMVPEATAYFVASLAGGNEVPPVNTPGLGTLIGELLGDSLTLTGAFSGLESDFDPSIAGGAHLHFGLAGENGPIVIELATTASTDNRAGVYQAAENRYAVTDGLVDTLRARQHYVNIHSQAYPMGEVRGQTLPLATAYFTAALSGLNEVPPLQGTGAVGGLKLELTDTTLTVTGAFSALEQAYDAGIGSHLHVGGPDANGPVEVVLAPALTTDLLSGRFLADSNAFELSEEVTGGLFAGNLYANVHSFFSPSGEVRGQVLKSSNFFPDSVSLTAPDDGAAITVEGPASTPFVPTWEASQDPDGNEVVYLWQLTPAADVNFATPLFTANTGDLTALSGNFGIVDSLLALAGVNVGESVSLLHRALVSDGSLRAAGPMRTVALTRGVVTNLDATARALRLQLYPSPTGDYANVALDLPDATQVTYVVTDLTGRPVLSERHRQRAGAHTQRLDLRDLPAGLYFVQLTVGDQRLPTQRLVKR